VEHISGASDTQYISAGLDPKPLKKYRSGNGLVAIDVEAAIAAGTGFVDHTSVLQVLRRSGMPTALKNAKGAQEVLFKGPIPHKAIFLIGEF